MRRGVTQLMTDRRAIGGLTKGLPTGYYKALSAGKARALVAAVAAVKAASEVTEPAAHAATEVEQNMFLWRASGAHHAGSPRPASLIERKVAIGV